MSTFGNRARVVAGLFALTLAVTTLSVSTSVTASASAATTSPAAGPRPGPCRTANLSLALDRSRHEAGLNHFGVDVVLTNEVPEQPCTLRGYLGLQLCDRDHKPLPTDELRGDTYFQHDPGPVTVVLSRRRPVAAEIEWSNATSPSERASHASYLRITVPGAIGGDFTVPFDKVDPGVYHGLIRTIALS